MKNPKAIANWVINNLRAKIGRGVTRRKASRPSVSDQENENLETGATPVLHNLKFKPEALLELIGLVESKTISSAAAQQVFAEMFELTGKSVPGVIVHNYGKRPSASQRHRRD